MNNSEKSLRTQWCNFVSTIFHPPVIIFLSCTVGLLFANYSIKDNQTITILLSVLMIFSSGLLGTFIRKRWEELAEKPHLLAKGKMAVRNLTLLFNTIRYYESRLVLYIARLEDKDLSKDRIIEYYEEFIDWCISLREICLTSIENWEDIIPEVKDLTSKIGTLMELSIRENELKNQLASLTQKLEKSEEDKEKTKEEKQELERILRKKEEEFNKVAGQVKELRQSIRSSVGGLTANVATLGTSGSYVSPLDKYGALPLEQRAMSKMCKLCNKPYYISGILSFIDDNICGECKKQGKGISLIGGS